MDDENNDWREQAIDAFEATYKKACPCDSYYPADELGKLFRDYCLECGWHAEDHGAESAEEVAVGSEAEKE